MLALTWSAPSLAGVLDQLTQSVGICCISVLYLAVQCLGFGTRSFTSTMGPAEPPGGACLPEDAGARSLQPASHVDTIPPVNTGELIYAGHDDHAFDEDEAPVTPSARGIEVEATPAGERHLRFLERRSKVSLVATTSGPLQLSVPQANVLDDEAFSFTPMYQHSQRAECHHTQHKGPAFSAPQEVDIRHDSSFRTPALPRYEIHSFSLACTDILTRDLVSLPKAGADLSMDRLFSDTSRDNEQTDDDETLALRQESLVPHLEHVEGQQTPPKTDDISHHGDHVHENNNSPDTEVHGYTDPHDSHDIPMSKTVELHHDHPSFADNFRHIQRSQHQLADSNGSVVDLTESSCAPEIASKSRTDRHLAMAGTRPIHDDRVSKRARIRRQLPVEDSHFRQQGNTNTTRQPSEEDLLFLLMSRARQNSDTRKKLDRLEQETDSLRQQKAHTELELQQALHARDEFAQNCNVLSQHLDSFKEKYHKLKKWALEANKDCQELQEKASSFQTALSDLTKDRDQLNTQLQDVQSSSNSASHQMENVRKGVREMKVMTEEQQDSITQLSTIKAVQDDQLRAESQRLRKLETHIAHLVMERDMQNVRLHSQQKDLNHTLQTMSSKLDNIQHGRSEDALETAHIIESLNRIRAGIENDLSKNSDIMSLKENIGHTNTSIGKLEESVSDVLSKSIATLKDDLQKEVSVHAQKLVSTLPTDKGEVAEAKVALARLEQKADKIQEVIKSLRDAKGNAEKNLPSLKDMADNLTKVVGPEREAAQKRISDLSTSVSEWRTKWQAVCSQLEKCKQDREEERTENRIQLDNYRQERKEEEDERKAQHESEITDLLGLLCEAAKEENCLRSELSKAEDLLNEVRRQNEQQHIEIVSSWHMVVEVMLTEAG